jgi:hypothetical protein
MYVCQIHSHTQGNNFCWETAFRKLGKTSLIYPESSSFTNCMSLLTFFPQRPVNKRSDASFEISKSEGTDKKMKHRQMLLSSS